MNIFLRLPFDLVLPPLLIHFVALPEYPPGYNPPTDPVSKNYNVDAEIQKVLGKLGDDLRHTGNSLGEYTSNILELQSHCAHLEASL